MLKVEIEKFDLSSKVFQKTIDLVAEEKPLHILLNRTPWIIINCTPSNLKELAVGHALSEGTVKSIGEIEEVVLKNSATCRIKLEANVDIKKRLRLLKSFSRIISSACGSPHPYQYQGKLPKLKSDLKVKAEVIAQSVNQLNSNAIIFRKTGGVHVAAIYTSDGQPIGLAEDIGRHNAVDKAIGIAILKNTDFSRCFLASSGRLTGDIVLKAARVGIPIVASLAAAIDSGISIAKEASLTLVGFVRGKHMNVYSFPERILP